VNESHLQGGHDDAADHEAQEELPAAHHVGFGEAADEEGQRPDEVDGRHGDHGGLGRVRRDVGTVSVAVASSVAAAVPRAVAPAAVPAATVSAAAVPAAVPATHPHPHPHPVLHVPHEGGGHAGEDGHAQHDHRAQHGLDEARRRAPLVEELRLVLGVVRAGRRRVGVVLAGRRVEVARRAVAVVGRRAEGRTVDRRTLVGPLVKHRSDGDARN